MTRDELVHSFEEQERRSAEYWSAFDVPAFFRPIGSGWSPSETVRHLNKSTCAVVMALGMPKLLLRFRFGRARRPSMSYDELHDRYISKLAEGAKAGRFGPSPRSEADLDAWRREIMSDFAQLHAALLKAIQRWPERALDRLQLPHPLLGKLTVREMLMFTLYHHRHHVEVVQRRLREAATA
jgi:DinB superfamily